MLEWRLVFFCVHFASSPRAFKQKKALPKKKVLYSRGWTCLTVANVVFAPFRPPSFTFGNILLPHTPNGVLFSLVQVQTGLKIKKASTNVNA